MAEDVEVGVEPGQLVLVAVAVDVHAAARQQLGALGLARLVRGRVAPEHAGAEGRREALDGGGVGAGGRGRQQRARHRERRRREEEPRARGRRHGYRSMRGEIRLRVRCARYGGGSGGSRARIGDPRGGSARQKEEVPAVL